MHWLQRLATEDNRFLSGTFWWGWKDASYFLRGAARMTAKRLSTAVLSGSDGNYGMDCQLNSRLNNK
jgi:hypothetical protein